MSNRLLALIAASLLVSSTVLIAQDDSSPSSSDTLVGAGGASGGNGERAAKIKEAFEQLDLSDKQKEQIKQIRAGTQPGPDRRRQIMAVLTPEQKQKLIAMIRDYRAGQGQ